MKNVHNIEPNSIHYACMIDLLGCAGLLEEAYNFIRNMPIEPDVVAWGSLLSSCRWLLKNCFLLIPIALANTLSTCGKWDVAAKVRKSMKEIANKVHIFGVEDSLHPQRDAIYHMISKIWKEIKKMGFIPDTNFVLHDLEQEVKEQILRHHSEKLAIAFALINTPVHTTLRIIKNLRVSNDCHSAIKYISLLVEREIIVRDAMHFLHFKDGSCSCQDY
ncbi:Pentatricopeptide repeat-containing protein [Glycine max]|nr:Pentatricopeptide repeat-containing protein [Glycine max]